MKFRQKFILTLLLIGLIPMLDVGIFAYISASNALLEKTTNQLNSTAIKQTERIDTIVQSRQEQATQAANQYDLRVNLAQYLAQPSDAAKQHLNTILQGMEVGQSTMQYIRLYDMTNTLIASSVTEQSSSDYLSKIITPGNGDVNSVRIVKDPRDNSIKLEVSTRINAQVILSAVFRTDDLTAVVQDFTGLDQTGETVVVGTDNVSLFPVRFNIDGALQTNLASLDASNTTSGVYKTATDYRGHEVLYVTHPVGLSNWTVIDKIDKDEALASTATLRTTMVWIVCAVCVLIIAMALVLTGFFTRPILRMVAIAKRIGDGDFSASVSFTRKDEIGTLGNSIDSMKENLDHLIRGIESQRERLEVILNTTIEGILAIDENSTILLANRSAEKLIGGTAKDLLGKNLKEVFLWEQGMQPFTVNYSEQVVKVYENLQFTDKQGTKRYVKLIVAPVHEEPQAGRTHAIVTIHDETSSRELENMKTDFVSMAAHELRTPLTAVRGYLEMASTKGHEQESVLYVTKALRNINELSGLINNLLDVTRIERGTLMLNMEKIDLAGCVAHAYEDARFLAEDRQINLSYSGPQKDKYVVGDLISLREIVNNLLSNAIKYTLPGGTVVMDLQETSDNTYAVTVKDTGVGISKEAQKYLFNKFYRVHGGLDSGSKGTGLGLYIARSIAERHEGTISVSSEEGKGSAFTLTLPIFTDEHLQALRADTDKKDTMTRRKRGWVTKNITR